MDTTQMINTRITLKIDTLANWNASTFKPLDGEVCLVKVDTVEGSTLKPIMFKVGDGEHTFSELDWASAKAADVYSWAKQNALVINKDGTGNVVASIEWDASLNGGKGGVKYTTASVATSEGLEEVQGTLSTLSQTVAGMYTNKQIDDAIATAKSEAESTASDALAGYIATNDAALAEVRATAEAATTVSEVDAQIDTKITALNLGTTYEPIGAENRAKSYVDDEIDKVEVALDKVVDGTTPVAKATEAGKVTKALTVGNKTFDGSAAVAVTAADLGLESAMHFVGALSEAPATAVNGDVYLNTDTKKEYVYSNNEWHELGDEGSYALRSITITGTDGLTGGGDLTVNRTISLSDTTRASLDKADTAIQQSDLDAAIAVIWTEPENDQLTGGGILGDVQNQVNANSGLINGLADSKADKVTGENIAGNFAGLDANGNLTNSGKKATDFEEAGAAATLQTALENGEIIVGAATAAGSALSAANATYATAIGTDISSIEMPFHTTVTGGTKYFVFNCGSATTLID